MSKNISTVYTKEIRKYESFKEKLEMLIKELLVHYSLRYHKIECRIKSVESLDKKIIRKEDKYGDISEITDLVGVRIITYFEDEVDKVAELLGREFEVDKENSIDKRQLENDRFGYKSLHFILKLKNPRVELPEYSRFAKIKFEVQIRSILQHAWAEIEHDLGYKYEHEIPKHYRRNFFRVAALLEIADIDFVKIKNELLQYETSVARELKTIKKTSNVDINKVSLRSYLIESSVVKTIFEEMNNRHSLIIDDRRGNVERNILRLSYFNITDIKTLDENLLKEEKNIINFYDAFISSVDSLVADKGIVIFYLCYVLATKNHSINEVQDYLKTTGLSNSNDNFGQELIEISKKIKDL